MTFSDKNHDGVVTEEEFVALPPGEVEGEWKDVDRIWQEERRKEYKSVIDIDGDGKVTQDELKVSHVALVLYNHVLGLG